MIRLQLNLGVSLQYAYPEGEMTHERDADVLPLPDDVARHLLARAAELDAAQITGLSIPQLREIASEAEIAPAAFESALSEARGLMARQAYAGGAVPTALTRPGAAPDSARSAVPRWVRLCLFGVPDRRAATGFYWLFVAVLCASPLLARSWLAGRGVLSIVASFSLLAFSVFAIWSTSRAIRWLDEHGWDSLR